MSSVKRLNKTILSWLGLLSDMWGARFTALDCFEEMGFQLVDAFGSGTTRTGFLP